MEDIGYSILALLLPATDIKIVYGSPSKVLVDLLVKISDQNHNIEELLSKQLMYCMEGVDDIYLSKECSIQLAILDTDFPRMGKPGRGRSRPRPQWPEIALVRRYHLPDILVNPQGQCIRYNKIIEELER